MKLVDRLIEWAKTRPPYNHLTGYMERYWLIPFCKARWVPAARFHHILRSDDDRVFHDHPWNYLTIILKGGYTEVTPKWWSGMYDDDNRKWFGAGSILFRKAAHWHRLELPPGETTWTLFISFGYRQKWGFLRHPDFKVRWEDYERLYKTDEEAR